MNFDFFSWFCCYNNGQQNRPEPQNSEELQRKVAIMRKFTEFQIVFTEINFTEIMKSQVFTAFQFSDINFTENSSVTVISQDFSIFLSLKLYVKTIFWDSRSAKTAIFAILGAVNFVNLEISVFKKCKNFNKIKFQSL